MIENPDAESVLEQYRRFGQAVPSELVAPDLHDVEYDYWNVFWELSTDRQAGSGYIPWMSIKMYSSMHPEFNQESLFKIIRAMDSAYISSRSGEQSKPFSREMLRGK